MVAVRPEQTTTTRPLPLVSAHRGGAGSDRARENTLGALREAAAMDCEYVEVDVRRCRDGVYVVFHDAHVRDGDRRVPVAALTYDEFTRLAGTPLLLDDALEALRGRTGVHLDLKFLAEPEAGDPVPPAHEVALVRHVVDVLGAGDVLVTGLQDEAVAAVRAWARENSVELLVGLSLSRDVGLGGLARLLTGRLGDALPGRRLRATGANLAVCHRTVARLWGARWAHRHGLPLLVWTVDDPAELRAWLRDERAWLVTTNHPRRALALRDELARKRVPAP
ncbi:MULTISPECIES: glycerophosphodiester phosphodiesterase [unclassified Blastococcus]